MKSKENIKKENIKNKEKVRTNKLLDAIDKSPIEDMKKYPKTSMQNDKIANTTGKIIFIPDMEKFLEHKKSSKNNIPQDKVRALSPQNDELTEWKWEDGDEKVVVRFLKNNQE